MTSLLFVCVIHFSMLYVGLQGLGCLGHVQHWVFRVIWSAKRIQAFEGLVWIIRVGYFTLGIIINIVKLFTRCQCRLAGEAVG